MRAVKVPRNIKPYLALYSSSFIATIFLSFSPPPFVQSSSLNDYNFFIFLTSYLFFKTIMAVHMCGQCRLEKPEEAFDVNSNGRRMRSCKPCLVGALERLPYYYMIIIRYSNKLLLNNRRGGEQLEGLQHSQHPQHPQHTQHPKHPPPPPNPPHP